MDERLRGVAEFVDVVESGSFAAAALRLGMTRSAVAKIVARLELRLGARLLQRTTRQLGLTDEGFVYYEQCRRLLAELGETEAALDAGRREPAGRVRISVPVLFGRQCVAPVVRRLVERHPRLEIDMSFSDRVADLVNDGFDLAVRIGELADTSALVGRKLGVQRMGICASPDYLARHGRPSGSRHSRRTSASRIRAADSRHRGGSSARMARCTTIARPAACGSTTCRRSPTRPPPARASRGCRAG